MVRYRKISLSSLSQCALWISVPLLSCSFAITRLFNAPSNVAVRQPAMTYSKTLAYRFWSCSWSRLTFTPILSMCFTTSQNSGNILSHLVFVPEKWSDVKSPITMSVSMGFADFLHSLELLVKHCSNASRWLFTSPRSVYPMIVPISLS